jgi:adenylate cyclase
VRTHELTREWNAAPQEVLRLCLYATRAGLLNLRWDMMCPTCRVAKESHSTLAALRERFHCDLCGVDYNANFDRYVEVLFAVHPAVRLAQAQSYCIGGPFLSPHILAQQTVGAGETITLQYPDTTAALRLRVLRANRVLLFDDSVGARASALLDALKTPLAVYGHGGWDEASLPRPHAGASLMIRNDSTSDVWLVLEKQEWDRAAVTAAQVTAMQEFRDLFSSQVLAAGQRVGIENLTVFFSDLRGSTSFYEEAGDAPAYSHVRRHFDFLTHHIAVHSGAVVKTMGDAVMAVFHTPGDAVRAALDIQKKIAAFNAAPNTPHAATDVNATILDADVADDATESVADDTASSMEHLVIKIGLHHGPAIAVNQNDKLDYFGRTVNIAARVQGASRGNDIVMSSACYRHSAVQNALREHGIEAETFQADLKGIAGIVTLYRAPCETANSEANSLSGERHINHINRQVLDTSVGAERQHKSQ